MGGTLKLSGAAGIAGGLITAFVALLMNTSVHSESSYRFGTYIPSSDTINIGLLQNQHLAFLAGGFLFLSGVIALCAGVVIDAIVAAGRSAGLSGPDVQPGAPRQRGEMTDEQRSAAAKADRFILVSAGVIGLLALIAIFAFGVGTGSGSGAAVDQAQIANNAEALADALERQADNLNAAADAVGK